ncbi:hypothetical protein BGZ65_001542 [Modicella reniformis]|uniref:F-box domain-containing protein n=1 Tax=Modicella reniformis TaxID=1440133 RepID=A0A9P6SVI0_9FUNG|nr:hypothetical protein BGZ65_001542 [Modicella reniformis]
MSSDSLPSVDRIPSEVLARIGQFLDGPTFLSSLHVSRLWYGAIRHLLWESISKLQWHHPAFPLQLQQYRGNYNAFEPQLFRTKYLEWYGNNAMTAEGSDVYRKTFLPRRQLSTENLVQLLSLLPNLVSLTFHMNEPGPGIGLFPTIALLPNLRKLDIDATCSHSFNPEDMFPLFSRLDELLLAGWWFNAAHERRVDPIENPWRMKRLIIRHVDISLVRYCPELRELVLTPITTFGYRKLLALPSLRILLGCPKLEKIKLPFLTRQDDIERLGDILSSLEQLKVLEYHVQSVKHLKFLCSTDAQVFRLPTSELDSEGTDTTAKLDSGATLPEMPGGTTVASASTSHQRHERLLNPLLEHLVISSVSMGQLNTRRNQLQQSLMDTLQTRSRLKTFVIQDHNNFLIEASYIFAQPGLEAQNGWACMNLERLSLRLSWPEELAIKEEERHQQWQTIYRQIAQLTKLQSLSIIAVYVEKGPESGMMELAGLKALRHLELLSHRRYSWTKDDIQVLLTSAPWLTSLNLRPCNANQIDIWIKEEGRRDIKFLAFS